MGSLVSLAIMKRSIVLCSWPGRIMLLRFRMLHSGLILDGFEDVLDRELQRGEAVIHSVSSEWALLRVQERTLLEGALLVTRVVDGGASMMQLRVLSVVSTVERLVGGALYCFLQLNVRLSSVQNLTPMGDVVIHQMFVQRVGDS